MTSENTEVGKLEDTMSQVTMTPLSEVDEADLCICGNPGDVECRKRLDNGEDVVWVSCTVCLEESVTEATQEEEKTVDPDQTLQELRELCAGDESVIQRNALEIAELFQALDQWIDRGGFLPAAWTAGLG